MDGEWTDGGRTDGHQLVQLAKSELYKPGYKAKAEDLHVEKC